RARLRQLANT
ncbi:flagellar M-ring protein FliF, partial [Vibrio parahaemolyticus VPTS-2010_2]